MQLKESEEGYMCISGVRLLDIYDGFLLEKLIAQKGPCSGSICSFHQQENSNNNSTPHKAADLITAPGGQKE